MNLSTFAGHPPESLADLRKFVVELLAFSFMEVFPDALLVAGKVTEFGFYYDFICSQPVDAHVVIMLEEKMRGIVKAKGQMRIVEMMRENAAMLFEHKQQMIKADRIRESKDNIVSILQIDDFYDYCDCLFPCEIQDVGTFKLFEAQSLRDYVKNEGKIDLKRVHGTAFFSKQELKNFVKAHHSGKKRDHQKIVAEQCLLEFNQQISSIAWEWNAKGEDLRRQLMQWWEKEHRNQHFSLVATPSLVKKNLLIKSGIEEEDLQACCRIEDVEYAVPPVLGPSHASLFSSRVRYADELPIRFAECGQTMTNFHDGNLWGLLDARFVSVDQAHIFCDFEKIEEEIISSLQFIDKFITMFNFEGYWYLRGRGRTRGPKPKNWNTAIDSVENAFKACGIRYQKELPENSAGNSKKKPTEQGSFKELIAEVMLRDAHGREWKGAYIGIDFITPERLKLQVQVREKVSLSGSGKSKTCKIDNCIVSTPAMLVRSMFRSFERFVAILLEHNAGRLPQWLTMEEGR